MACGHWRNTPVLQGITDMSNQERRLGIIESDLYGKDGLRVQVTELVTTLRPIPAALLAIQTDIRNMREAAAPTEQAAGESAWTKLSSFASVVKMAALSTAA